MPDGRKQYEAYARKVAKENGIPPGLFVSLVTHESGWVPTARSPAGAYGLAQLMPQYHKGDNIEDPYVNLRLGAQELGSYFKGTGGLDKQYAGSWRYALAAYNAGPGNVNKYGGIPPFAETQRYVPAVLGDAAKYGNTVPQDASVSASPPVPAPPTPPKAPSVPQIDFAPYVLSHLGKSGGLGGLVNYVQQQEGLLQAAPSPAVPSAAAPVVRAPRQARTQAPQGQPAKAGYPLGKQGAVIGTPYSGTHTLGNWQSDNAIDISVPVGTPVYATEDGTIGPRIGSLGSGGRFAGLRLTLEGGDNQFYYAHLSRLNVKGGQKVRKGQLLGYSGEANGVAHLHIGILRGDPRKVLL